MERKHVERVYGIKRVAHEIIRYNVFFFFFFFFLCVQLQHGTGESIIIDVIFFERGTCARELVILGTERVLVGGRGDIW